MTTRKTKNERFLLINYLTSTYPLVWRSTNPKVLTNIGMASTDFLISKINETVVTLGLHSSNRPISHPPVYCTKDKKVNGVIGTKSSVYHTVEVELSGKRYFIKHSNGSSLNGMETVSKEMLFMFFAESNSEYQNFNMSFNRDFKRDSDNLLRRMISELSENKTLGVPKSSIDEVLVELKNELLSETIDQNKTFMKSVFNSMSGGNSLSKLGLTRGRTLHRDKYLKLTREFVGRLHNFSKRMLDNCFPIDSISIRNGFEDKIEETFKNIEMQENKGVQCKMLNDLFVDLNDPTTFDRPLFGISLKQSKARVGKGKSAVGTGGNMTKEELSMNKDQLLSKIVEFRTKLTELKIDKMTYNLIGDIDGFENTDAAANKFAALKLTYHMLTSSDDLNKYLENLLNTCAGLGNNPPYTKIVLDERGDDHKVKYVNYKASDKLSISPYSKITITDKNSSTMIVLNLDVVFNDEISRITIEIRTNGSDQCTVELKDL